MGTKCLTTSVRTPRRKIANVLSARGSVISVHVGRSLAISGVHALSLYPPRNAARRRRLLHRHRGASLQQHRCVHRVAAVPAGRHRRRSIQGAATAAARDGDYSLHHAEPQGDPPVRPDRRVRRELRLAVPGRDRQRRLGRSPACSRRSCCRAPRDDLGQPREPRRHASSATIDEPEPRLVPRRAVVGMLDARRSPARRRRTSTPRSSRSTPRSSSTWRSASRRAGASASRA